MKISNFCLTILFLFALFFVSGCDSQKPAILFYNQPITQETIKAPGKNFRAGTKIYYLLWNPKGFDDNFIRVQLVKKDEKTQYWGYSIYWSKDYEIDATQNYFIDDITITESGYYFMQIFSFKDFDWPIARGDFWIKPR